MRSKDYYAAIDLGSNSFHMLVVRVVAGSLQVVSKIRRKVRLAGGLQADGTLDAAARERALDCLAIFADRVRDIAPENITAVGTATLRKLKPEDPFLEQVRSTLGHPLRIISGDEEAATIFQGIAHTTSVQGATLVIDIGGASTEIVVGEGFEARYLQSLDMGCVTLIGAFFDDGRITPENTDAAITHVMQLIEPHAAAYKRHGWDAALGASGTFKSLQEMALARGLPLRFTLPWLEQLLNECLQYGRIDALELHGLRPPRRPVFISGLCILIGAFRALKLTTIEATEGALREGLIYGMLHELQHADVQLRTLMSLVESYHLDYDQIARVEKLAQQYLEACPTQWLDIQGEDAVRLVRAASYLHEIGLTLNYKHASSHGRYVLAHSNLPGFSVREREFLLELLGGVAGIIDDDAEPDELPDYPPLARLTRVMRLAVMGCQRRRDDMIANGVLTTDDEHLTLHFPRGFLQANPYLRSLYEKEALWQQRFGGLTLKEV